MRQHHFEYPTVVPIQTVEQQHTALTISAHNHEESGRLEQTPADIGKLPVKNQVDLHLQ